MSHHGTVYCRYCYEKGHNKRTCPKLKEWMKEHPEHGHTKYILEKESKARQRTCRYCDQSGHNRQTCPKLLKDKVSALTQNRTFRQEALAMFKDKGIGLGTLLTHKSCWMNGQVQTEDVELLLIVDEIRWDQILYQGGSFAIMVNNHGERDLQNSFSIQDLIRGLKTGRTTIEHPTTPDNIGVGIPEDWEKGATNLKQAFDHWDDKL